MIPGAPALAPAKFGSLYILGGCVSKGSMGSKFVAKYMLLIGHIKEIGLNSVFTDRKFFEAPSTNTDERLDRLFGMLIC